MNKEYAVIGWTPADVKEIRPHWDDELCVRAISYYADDLKNMLTEEGWGLLHMLVGMYEHHLEVGRDV